MNSTIEDLVYYDVKTSDKKEENIKNIRKELLTKKYELFSSEKGENDSIKRSILDIINSNDRKNLEPKDYDENKKEYKSIIKFSIFLIHVLKIFIARYENKNGFKELNDIVVNDMYLLNYFHRDETLTEFLFDKDTAKEFILLMLKLRILFDYLVFKRDESGSPIIFKRKNKNLLMIELLFNVSSPQYFAQDWIAVVLSYLLYLDENVEDNKWTIDDGNNGTVISGEVEEKVIDFLEEFDREVALVRLKNGEILEFVNDKILKFANREIKGKEKPDIVDMDIDKLLENKLNKGTSTPHYWFYKLDYLLWKKEKSEIWKDVSLINLSLSIKTSKSFSG